ncbi:hypothetical protein CPB86DRAFT_873227 [Serendipita vermifera]|nr:hypothetical protein CPB86DRAFT_873227 [Serendipita vermifera]
MQSITSDSNEEERISLLQQISALKSKGEELLPTKTSLIRDLKSRHNALVQANSRTFRLPDPSQDLPPEIWTHILLMIVEDDCVNILPLTQVCQHWASIILSEARIWTFIHIKGDIEALELAHSALFLSKGLPLCMTVDIPIVSVVLERFLQREANRIRHLKIKPMSGYFQTWIFGNSNVHIVEDLLKGLGSLPSLESLTINIKKISLAILSSALRFLIAPNIKYLIPALFPGDLSALSRFTQLRSLATFLTLETVIPELVGLTDLKKLVFWDFGEYDEGSPSLSYVRSCENIAPVEYLSSYQEPSDYIWPLLSQISSRVRKLDLKIRWKQALDFFIIVHGAPCLHELDLFIIIHSKDEVNATHWKAPTLPQIQKFGMDMYVSSSAKDASNTVTEITTTILGALNDSLVGIRKLHIKAPIFGSDLVRFIQGMKHLNTLRLDKSVEHDQARTISCPSLNLLEAHDARVLRYLSMPNLISYILWKYQGPDIIWPELPSIDHNFLAKELPNIDRKFTANVQSLYLDGRLAAVVGVDESEFTQLRTLTWLMTGGLEDAGYRVLYRSFPSLTTISFEESNGQQGGNHFCELLLRYPRTCPRLETIRICGYPNWDILLYMLFRRNVEHGRKDISAIKSIELPGYPAPCILMPLSTLLLGKIPLKMPSLGEFWYADIFCDPAISGCASCINCGLTCSTSAIPPDTSDGSESFQVILEKVLERMERNEPLGSDPPLPDYVQGWLDSYLEKWSIWAERQKQNGFKGIGERSSPCARHDYSQLVVIDGHTLDGVGIDSKELEYPVSQADDARDW